MTGRYRPHPLDAQAEAESDNESIDVVRLSGRITTHEAVCAQRWDQMLMRMTRVENIILKSVGALLLTMLTGMGGIIATLLLTKHP